MNEIKTLIDIFYFFKKIYTCIQVIRLGTLDRNAGLVKKTVRDREGEKIQRKLFETDCME